MLMKKNFVLLTAGIILLVMVVSWRMSEVFKWFKDAGHDAFVASLLSIAAIIVSILAFKKSQKTQNRLVDIEEAREKDRLSEKQKAYLTALIAEEKLSRSVGSRIYRKYYLVVENKGLSEARKIKLLLADKPALEHPAVQKPQKEVEHIGPQSSFRYEFAQGFMRELPLKAEVTWEDGSGEPGKYTTTLTW